MPAYAALRRETRKRGQKRGVDVCSDIGSVAAPAELSIQQQLGLANGVSLTSPLGGKASSTMSSFDPARAAMAILKEEDHVWTIETCMETINMLRARNNGLKAELLDVDTNFHDHVEARQRRIAELTATADSLAHAKAQLEATLESERSEQRRRERDFARQREIETGNFDTTIKNLTEEVDSLQAFAGERDKVNAAVSKLEAENTELKDQQELKLQSLRKELAAQRASKGEDVRRMFEEARANLRDEVEISFGGEYERMVTENRELKNEVRKLDRKLEGLLSELVKQVSLTENVRRELDILRDLETKSAGKLKYYMRMLQRSAEQGVFTAEKGPGDDSSPIPRGKRLPISDQNARNGRRPETAPAKVCRAHQDAKDCPSASTGPCDDTQAAVDTSMRSLDYCKRCGATSVRSRSAGASRCPAPPRRRPSHRFVAGKGGKKASSCKVRRGSPTKVRTSGRGMEGNKIDSSADTVPHSDTTSRQREHGGVGDPEILSSENGNDQPGLKNSGSNDTEVEGKMKTSGETVQCWRDLDDYLQHRGMLVDTPRASVRNRTRPATCGGRKNSPRRPSGSGRQASHAGHVRHQHHHASENTNDDDLPSSPPSREANKGTYPATGWRHGESFRRPWTASAVMTTQKRYMAPKASDAKRYTCWVSSGRRQHGKQWQAWHGGEREARVRAEGGKLWGKQRCPGLELYEELHGRRFDDKAVRMRESDGHLAVEDANVRDAGADAKEPCNEDQLLRELDEENSDLLSPGRAAADIRAARVRAALNGGVLRLAKKPQQTVLVREMIGGVGTGRATEPRKSELFDDAQIAAAAAAAAETVQKAGRTPESDPDSSPAHEERITAIDVANGGLDTAPTPGDSSASSQLRQHQDRQRGRQGSLESDPVGMTGSILVAASYTEDDPRDEGDICKGVVDAGEVRSRSEISSSDLSIDPLIG